MEEQQLTGSTVTVTAAAQSELEATAALVTWYLLKIVPAINDGERTVTIVVDGTQSVLATALETAAMLETATTDELDTAELAAPVEASVAAPPLKVEASTLLPARSTAVKLENP